MLILNDTTTISYKARREVKGFTRGGKGMPYGFQLHNALMVDADNGAVLGLARQELFYRIPAPKEGEPAADGAVPARRTCGAGSSMPSVSPPTVWSTSMSATGGRTLWKSSVICSSTAVSG